MAVRKTALLIDDELVGQVRAILGTSTTTETISAALREVIQVRGRARLLERLRRRDGIDLDDSDAMHGAWQKRVSALVARYLADTSTLARLHHDDVLARVGPLFVSGDVARCGIVDLELLYSVRSARHHVEVRREQATLPGVPIVPHTFERAAEVQGALAEQGNHRAVPIPHLLVAAAAEDAGLTVLHYDEDFDLIATITGQPTEWVVPTGSVP